MSTPMGTPAGGSTAQPPHEFADAPPPLPPPSTSAGTYTRLRNEVMAGGTEHPDGGEVAGGMRAVVGLGIIAAALVALAWWSKWGFVFVVGLLVSIFLHELGHFATAKWTGMKATGFFLFMGPKLWSFRRGETEYGIRAYPLGAFVRIIGMNNLDDVDPADEPRAYRNQSFPRRLLVITAGSIMHLIIAAVLLFGVFAVNGRRVTTDRIGFGSVVVDGPAATAGVRAGDELVSLDGQRPERPEGFTQLIQAHRPGDRVTLVVQRDGVEQPIEVVLGEHPSVSGRAFLGVSSGFIAAWNQESVASAAVDSVTNLGTVAWQTVGGVVKVLNPVNIVQHLTGANDDPTSQPSTVIGASRFTSELGQETGLGGVLLALAGINVFVGLFNMIPLLPFDGGHAAIAIYERLRSKRGKPYHADVSKMLPVAMVTMVFLGFMFLSAVYLDFAKPVR